MKIFFKPLSYKELIRLYKNVKYTRAHYSFHNDILLCFVLFVVVFVLLVCFGFLVFLLSFALFGGRGCSGGGQIRGTERWVGSDPNA